MTYEELMHKAAQIRREADELDALARHKYAIADAMENLAFEVSEAQAKPFDLKAIVEANFIN